MPRTKTYTWATRLEVFLTYRLGGGRVNAVANRHGMARSTVRIIVKEFEELGFSSQPRAKVSPGLLEAMQHEHLDSIVGSLGGSGKLDIGSDDDDEVLMRQALAVPPAVEDDLAWHLRDTAAGMMIQEATDAARDYRKQGADAWQELGSALEVACDLPALDDEVGSDPDPHLFPWLKRVLRNAFFDPAFLMVPPGPGWLEWGLDPDITRVLRLQRRNVAIGSSEDHLKIQEGVTSFLADGFKDHQKRFYEVHRLHQDMVLMQGVVRRTLDAIEIQDIRGICPSCPYPESSLRLEPDGVEAMEGSRL